MNYSMIVVVPDLSKPTLIYGIRQTRFWACGLLKGSLRESVELCVLSLRPYARLALYSSIRVKSDSFPFAALVDT
jgi:hypothetical protein